MSDPETETGGPPDIGPMTERFNLAKFTDDLIQDLHALRAGRISIADARVRADMARQVIRSVQLMISAQKYLESQAKRLPAIEASTQ